MRLYFECNMGAAGDMLMAALLELLPEKDVFLDKMNSLLPGMRISWQQITKCGVTGSQIHVLVHGGTEEDGQGRGLGPVHHAEHDCDHTQYSMHEQVNAHYSFSEICALIGSFDLPEKVRSDAYDIYRMIGDAESVVHGTSIEQVHFHEVGSLDAIADTIGCSLLIHMLGVDDITCSPIHVGSGSIQCAHGVLPVPAPATALILRGVPIYGGEIIGELCTPTGAAILRHFADRFGDMAPMSVERIGYGMGTREFEVLSCVRAFLGKAC